MNAAYLHNGQLISADQYEPESHGQRLYCIDKKCKAPVVFVSKGKANAHFKTTGRGESKHISECGFYEPLDLIDSIKKVGEYQEDILDKGMKETVVRLSMNRIDPDYEPNSIEREKKNSREEKEVKVKGDNETPKNISSVKSVVKLLTSYEPDILASILINVGGGMKIPLSSVVINQERAHNMLWSDETIPKLGYFVYGKIQKIVKREKVMYINFYPVNDVNFTIVVFERYWKEFSYKESQLKDKDVLIYGHLRKNDFQQKQETEMLIKSKKYLEFFKRKKVIENEPTSVGSEHNDNT
ncbi:hypothetical protein V1503_24075 [Bacillus sp. SCS-151]|uniref:hypothetical protein n=1 Tax=Nanhaiella sioensis TaxID=3115293 RepID=UPI00397D6EE4